tara:strand:+ start:135 stop:338 length:204 start_codon:yes stop_codon:yes gene_type:complete
MKGPFNPAVEDMYQVEAAAVGLICVDTNNIVAALLEPLSCFAYLHAIATTPFAGRSVIDQEYSHSAQ